MQFPTILALLLTILLCTTSTLLAGCNFWQPARMHKAVALDFKVRSPEIHQITAVAERIELAATGNLTPGTFFLETGSLTVQPGTTFRLTMEIPVTDPDVISTRHARGTLWTSRPISVNTMPIPQVLSLTQGKVSGELDAARCLGGFLVNLLQVGVVTAGEDNLIETARVEMARIDLREGQDLHLGRKVIRVGPGSTITLRDVVIDKDMNYQGNLNVEISFLPGCRWLGEKVDCTFEGGHAQLDLQAKKLNQDLILSLPPDQAGTAVVTMRPCSFRFGKNKRSQTQSSTCNMRFRELVWQRSPRCPHPTLHFQAAMLFADTNLDLKTDIHRTLAHFPGNVAGNLGVAIGADNDKRKTSFDIPSLAHASRGTVTIAKSDTSLVLELSDATIGPITYDRFGWLNFNMQKGIARLDQLRWTKKQSSFALTASKDSTITVPSDMLVEKDQPHQKTHLSMPVVLKLGSAVVTGPKGKTTLQDLKGRLFIDVDGEIKLASDLDFSLGKSALFGTNQVAVGVRGLDLSAKNGDNLLHLKKCTIIAPDRAIEEAVAAQTPHAFSLNLDRTVLPGKKWRYRNAVATKVKVDDFKINEIEPLSASKVKFQATGNVVVDGTVEKHRWAAAITGGERWQTRPWSLSGMALGEGELSYICQPADRDNPCQLRYALKLNVPVPADVKLDWSQVAHVLRQPEQNAILSRLRQVTIPVSHAGTVSLFKDTDPFWRRIKMKDLALAPATHGTRISFSADVPF